MDQVGFWKLTACVDSTGRPGCSQLQCGHTVQVTLPSVLQSNIFFYYVLCSLLYHDIQKHQHRAQRLLSSQQDHVSVKQHYFYFKT